MISLHSGQSTQTDFKLITLQDSEPPPTASSSSSSTQSTPRTKKLVCAESSLTCAVRRRPFQARAKKGSTCTRCRKQKARCDGVLPCAICVTHGEGIQCTYVGNYIPKPSTHVEERSEATELYASRAEVHRLQETIARLEAFLQRPSPYPLAVGVKTVNVIQRPLELEVDCVGGALGRLLHDDNWGEFCREGERSPLVHAARLALRSPSSFGRLEYARGPKIENVVTEVEPGDIRRILPTPDQAQLLVKLFFARYNWLLLLLQPATFMTQCYTNMRLPPGELRWDWIALILAVCRAGLGAVGKTPVHDPNLFDAQSRHELGDLWLKAALSSLMLGDLDANPTLDGFRALSLLVLAFMILGESSDAAGMQNLLQLYRRAGYMASLLKLHVDPLLLSGEMDLATQTDRRCLWWGFRTIGTILGNASGVFSVIVNDNLADVCLPDEPPPISVFVERQKCPCGNVCLPWDPRRGLKARYLLGAHMYGLITTLPFRRNPPVVYKEVMDLHRRLYMVYDEVPVELRLTFDGHNVNPKSLSSCGLDAQKQISFHMYFHYLLLRLHRTLHTLLDVKSANVPFHRREVLNSARILFGIRRLAKIGTEEVLPWTMFIAAAISISIDLVHEGTMRGTEEAIEIEHEVVDLITTLKEAQAPVLERGRKVLEFLVAALDIDPKEREKANLNVAASPTDTDSG